MAALRDESFRRKLDNQACTESRLDFYLKKKKNTTRTHFILEISVGEALRVFSFGLTVEKTGRSLGGFARRFFTRRVQTFPNIRSPRKASGSSL